MTAVFERAPMPDHSVSHIHQRCPLDHFISISTSLFCCCQLLTSNVCLEGRESAVSIQHAVYSPRCAIDGTFCWGCRQHLLLLLLLRLWLRHGASLCKARSVWSRRVDKSAGSRSLRRRRCHLKSHDGQCLCRVKRLRCAGRGSGKGELQVEVGGTRREYDVHISCALLLRGLKWQGDAQRRRLSKRIGAVRDAGSRVQAAKVTSDNKRLCLAKDQDQ